MKLSNKAYDILKWFVMIVIPALTTAYIGLSKIWNWPYPVQVGETSAIICALMGALLGISTAQYNKQLPASED